MRIRLAMPLAAAAATVGAAVAALPSSAATPPQIVDAAGDANGINGQGVLDLLVDGGPDNVSSGPVGDAAADITSVRFATKFVARRVGARTVQVPAATVVTMTLAAPPTTPETFYRVYATTKTCSDLFLEYGTDIATGGPLVRCPSTDPTAKDKEYDATAAVKGSTITWTIPVSAIPAGTTFTALSADTRFNPAVVTAPIIDAARSTKTFTVGK
jgi:hypothetical protein